MYPSGTCQYRWVEGVSNDVLTGGIKKARVETSIRNISKVANPCASYLKFLLYNHFLFLACNLKHSDSLILN